MSKISAVDVIFEDEMDVVINNFGAFTGILLNKNISCVTFFMQLMKDDELRETILDLTGCTWYELVRHMALRYPILHKSKKVKRVV